MTVPMGDSSAEQGSSRLPTIPAAGAEEHLPLLDLTHINQLCAVLGSTRVENLLNLLSRELVGRPALIRHAVLAGDLSRARHESHSFKGATTSVGAMALGYVAGSIERAPDLKAMAAALPALDCQAARTRHAVATFLLTKSPGFITG